jgi:hypothetical protein
MKDNYKNFYCGLCKLAKLKAERQKIILYDIINDELLSSDVCSNDFLKLKYILSLRQITKKGQVSLDSWGIEIE